ncbi:MAG: NAD-dependent epimerase/dehydratase family protein [Nocardioides sp.]|nr:NAD-dependent epimerase/dehydratase family protein [Nocardioides sp.]
MVAALSRRGAEVVSVGAPRLRTAARDMQGLRAEVSNVQLDDAVMDLRGALLGATAVVNAAGIADATSGARDDLFGANALLPAIAAAARPARARLVHVSSAAVQGRRAFLDETLETDPFSPYSRSKALGEGALYGQPRTVIFRPTSVHGRGRPTTTSLIRFLSSRLASVAGAGEDLTPQVLLSNTADAVAFLALCEVEPPPVVLQPSEGITTAELVRVLGGREPLHVPTRLARVLVNVAGLMGRFSGRAAGHSRRLELLWFGQAQVTGWLSGRWEPPVGREGWRDVAW